LRLTEYKAEELAFKLEVLGSTYLEIERDEIKEAKDKIELERRIGGRS
jgi:hypothetical protein